MVSAKYALSIHNRGLAIADPLKHFEAEVNAPVVQQ
jgi:hypothetical protein